MNCNNNNNNNNNQNKANINNLSNINNNSLVKQELHSFEKFFNIVSAISRLDIDAFMECSYIDSPVICNVLRQPNTSHYYLYFVPEEVEIDYFKIIKQNIDELKQGNYEYFFEFGNFNFDAFFNENFYSKQDFYILERVVS